MKYSYQGNQHKMNDLVFSKKKKKKSQGFIDWLLYKGL